MRITRYLVVLLAALALVAAGCGEDESGEEAQNTTTAENEPEPANPNEAPADTDEAVREAVLKWTFEGDCDSMTDKFLQEQAFTGDTREERCQTFEKSFSKPQYSESDLKFRKVEISGNTAVVTVGSDIANVETDYRMVKSADGKWQIDEADIK